MKYPLFLLICFSFSTTFSQDLIVKKNGTRINVHIKEYNKKQIKFTISDDPDMKVNTLPEDSLISIRYANGKEIIFDTSKPSFSTLPGPGVTDADGNIYTSVILGRQEWMGSNLKTTKYNDGKEITLVTDGKAWSKLITPAYCLYQNDASKSEYGALYNWYTVNTGKLCPTGWHVPTHAEWTVLEEFTGGSDAGNNLKETGIVHWSSPNSSATNASRFSALPGGYRSFNGSFFNIGHYAYWWSSTESNDKKATTRYLRVSISNVITGYEMKESGFSVRCLKD